MIYGTIVKRGKNKSLWLIMFNFTPEESSTSNTRKSSFVHNPV